MSYSKLHQIACHYRYLTAIVIVISGFLRIESVDHTEASKSLVGRRYIAVRGAMMCVYKEEKDFVDDAPVVELEMKLACIKVSVITAIESKDVGVLWLF